MAPALIPHPGPDAPPWIVFAFGELGVKEIVGVKHNPRVVWYHSHSRLHAKDDETAWCSSFQNTCLDETGYESTHSAAAASYLTYGEPCELRDGCIGVFSKADPDAKGTGHVAMYWKGKWIGGNQNQRVSWVKRDLSRLVATRWPVKAGAPKRAPGVSGK